MMRKMLKIGQALELFFQRGDDSYVRATSGSESDGGDYDDEVDYPSFLIDDEEEDEQTAISLTPPTHTRRTMVRGRATENPVRSRSPQTLSAQPDCSSNAWRTENDLDNAPRVSMFIPRRMPGVQIVPHETHMPLDLFKLFFTTKTMRMLCKNTNKYAAKFHGMIRKYIWDDVEVEELDRFLGLLIYTSLLSLPCLQDYWKQNHILSVPFPATVMTKDRFRSLLSNIHISDPEEDIENERKKGTPQHDILFEVKPLIDDIRSACHAHYHPRRELIVDQRIVATKVKTGIMQYMKNKPIKWGIKLFVLAESNNGYTINFNVYVAKSKTPSVHGQSYDAVMGLIEPSYLGTGYHIYMDSLHTSPKLFLDLALMNFGACGTYRDDTAGCPTERENALTRKSRRGTLRWIREGPLVFVKWMDTKEVSVCSTIHPAISLEISYRVKGGVKDISFPNPISAYKEYMGEFDMSEHLTQHYSTHLKTARWYRTLFFHLVEISTTNAYILHTEICSKQNIKPMTHKDFLVELVSQLCGIEKTGVPVNRTNGHVPIAIANVKEPRAKATKGRRVCQNCQQVGKKRNLTPWMCKPCDVALCVILDRNCFEDWHK